MSKLVRKHASFLRLVLSTTSTLQRKALLDTITNDQLKALTEVSFNLLQGVLTITPSYRTKLKRYKKLVRLIGDKTVSLKQKKELLCRQGRIVALLLKSVEPALNTFLT
jgi:hypothetical protein